MRTILLSLAAIALLAAPLTAYAQDTGEWELPDNLKGELKSGECPEGTVRDEKGFCIKKPPEPPKPPEPTKPPEEPKPPTPGRPPVRPPVAPPAEAPAPVVEEKQPIELDKPAEEKPAEEKPAEETPAEEEKKPAPEGTPEGAAEPAAETAEKEKPKKAFIKGELANFIGSTKLVTKNSRFGVRLGYLAIDVVHYATVNPEVDIRLGKLTFGIGVPLALEIFDGAVDENDDVVGFSNAGDIRTEDWDEPSEYVRFIRYLQYGKKEDRFFFNLSQFASTSIGHGTLMRRYSNNIDPDSSRVSGELDMYNDYAGFEFVTNSIIDWDLFGGIAFVKPLSFFSDNDMARSFSIGFTYIADRHAPVRLWPQEDDTGAFIHPFRVGTEHGRPKVRNDAFLHAMGIDAEIKVVKTESVDIKPFVDYSWMMPDSPGDGIEEPEGGGGLTLGVLGRFNFGEETVHALRAIAEFRSFSADYLPGYFDIFYEVQKYMANQRYDHYARIDPCPDTNVAVEDRKCLPPTKFYDVFIERKEDDRHLGFYLEFNYSMVGYLTLTLALEGSDADEGSHFMAHLEVPAISWLQFFFSFHQRAMQDLGDLFSTDSNDKILFAAARLRLLPFLFINLRYQHTFQILSGTANLNDQIQEYRYYEPAHNYLVDVELGWEF